MKFNPLDSVDMREYPRADNPELYKWHPVLKTG